mmetsp:Transcript_44676/g.75190  ORF Transcript_44676/g.75190 Transcript_44676/m.75190 type:complete len:100 (-) Transcript_44676:3043-3342(-)
MPLKCSPRLPQRNPAEQGRVPPCSRTLANMSRKGPAQWDCHCPEAWAKMTQQITIIWQSTSLWPTARSLPAEAAQPPRNYAHSTHTHTHTLQITKAQFS